MAETATMTLPFAASACRDAGAGLVHAADLIDMSEGLSGDDLTGQLVVAFREVEASRSLAGQSQQTIIDALREQGCTWQRVGQLLGMSRQAAWERFGKGSHRGRG